MKGRVMRRGLGRLLALLALAAVSAAEAARAEPPAVVLFAAGSLREVMTRLAGDFEAARHVAVRPEFGPSGLLRERIERGDKADLLASADVGHPLTLQREGRADHVSLFARNAVCAFAPGALGLTADSLLARLLEPALRLGIAAAKADPLGDYTQEIFRRADGLRPGAAAALGAKARIVTGAALPGPSPAAGDPVIAQLRDGGLDVYLGYCSGRARFTRELPEVQVVELPPALRVGPEYGLARITGASPAATEFALYVLSPEGQRTLAAHGFVPVALPAS
jgi:ABC-type molybdate transport system substrate-binding protein